jgi:hypothetical protein
MYSTMKSEYEQALRIPDERERDEKLRTLDSQWAEKIILASVIQSGAK